MASETSMASEIFAYDAVLYPTAMPGQMSPDRIRGAGILQGWLAPDPAKARVLEIGGGDGLNMLAFAAAYPQARAAHFDLSQVMVERGRKLAAAAGLTNLDLGVGDITTWPKQGESYDYIISHGVYAWVPAEARSALLQLIAARLKPGGIAYVSFDALPAAAPKYELARFLAPHVAQFKTANDRVGAGISILRLLAANQHADSRLKAQLDVFLQVLPKTPAEHTFHDVLAEHYRPASLTEFAAAARQAGLMMIGDAAMIDTYVDDLNAEARQALAQIGPDLIKRGSLMDALRGSNMFRRALLARTDAPPPSITPHALNELRFEIMGRREEVQDKDRRILRYTNDRGSAYAPMNPQIEAMLDLVISEAPREVPYEELAAIAKLDTPHMLAPLRTACVIDLMAAHATPATFSVTAGEKPTVSPLARAMLAEGDTAASLRSVLVQIPDMNLRRLACLCDGTRTRTDLARELAAGANTRPDPNQVEAGLDFLRRARLLLS